MKKSKEKLLKKRNGITLISLVLTILVLIILARSKFKFDITVEMVY